VTGEVTKKLRERLTGLQHGTVEDVHGWMTKLA
jgi:branched-chain amino acid aminotransferase